MTPRVPIWLDCDPGHDDAFAVLLAAYNQNLDLLGVSTVYGNASLSRTTTNTLRVLTAIAKETIPVFPGAAKPYCRQPVSAKDIHGESGLDGTSLLPTTDRCALHHCNAIKEMRDSLMTTTPQTAWLVATGSLTNIGLLFAVFPEVAQHIKGLSIMGGAIGDGFTDVYMGPEFADSTGKQQARIGNTTPWAEFNIWCDPEAAKSIFDNSELACKTTLITLDLTHQVLATREVRDLLLFSKVKQEPPTRLRRMFYELLMYFAETYDAVFKLKEGPPLHDPIAVAVLLSDQVVFNDQDGERWSIEIITDGDQTGRTVARPSQTGIRIPRHLDVKSFWDVIEDSLTQADSVTGHRT